MAGVATATAVNAAAKSKLTPWIVGGVVIVGVGLSVFIVIKVLEALQLKQTRAEKKDARKADRLTTDQSFDPTHARNKPSRVTISNTKAEKLARDIYISNGHIKAELEGYTVFGIGGYLYDDDEAKLKGAIRDAGTTHNLSKVADVFYRKYRLGLLDHIKGFTNDSELSEIKDIVDNYKS